MKAATYDIFRKDLLGTPVWMEAAQEIATAKLRMMELTSIDARYQAAIAFAPGLQTR